MRQPLDLLSCGVATAVGRDSRSSAAAMRGGISGFNAHPYVVDAGGNPVIVAPAPWLEYAIDPERRYEELLIPVLCQATAPLTEGALGLRVALALALPLSRPGVPVDLERSLRASIERNYPSLFAAIGVFPAGHAGGFVGLDTAWRHVDEGRFDACVVAGVDSYVSAAAIEWLEENDRLHGAGVRPNPWGSIPGEAAAAILLSSASVTRRVGQPASARVLSVGLAHEPNRHDTKAVCVGRGLTEAMRAALARARPDATVATVFADLDGGPYRSDEYGFAMLRVARHFAPNFDCVTPADCFGDTGAASASLLVAMAAEAGRAPDRSGGVSLVFAGSDDGTRGAVLMESFARRG